MGYELTGEEKNYIKPMNLVINDDLQNHINQQQKSIESLKKNPLMIPKHLFDK